MEKDKIEEEEEEDYSEDSEPENAAQTHPNDDPAAARYTSFFIFSYHNPLRAGCRWVAESKVSFSCHEFSSFYDLCY